MMEGDIVHTMEISLDNPDAIADAGKMPAPAAEMTADKAKKKLPKWSHAKVVDHVGEISATVATALPALMNSLATAQQKPNVEERLAKLQDMFEAGKITASEQAAARAACLSAM